MIFSIVLIIVTSLCFAIGLFWSTQLYGWDQYAWNKKDTTVCAIAWSMFAIGFIFAVILALT